MSTTTRTDRYGFAETPVTRTPASEAAAERVRLCDEMGLNPWPAISELEVTCRAFAEQYPTLNVLRAIALAEQDRITWAQVAGLFEKALGDGLAAIR